MDNKNKNMNTIKFLKNNYIQLNNIIYKPYPICDLPERFGLIDGDGNSYYTEWFNYKGLTYIQE